MTEPLNKSTLWINNILIARCCAGNGIIDMAVTLLRLQYWDDILIYWYYIISVQCFWNSHNGFIHLSIDWWDIVIGSLLIYWFTVTIWAFLLTYMMNDELQQNIATWNNTGVCWHTVISLFNTGVMFTDYDSGNIVLYWNHTYITYVHIFICFLKRYNPLSFIIMRSIFFGLFPFLKDVWHCPLSTFSKVLNVTIHDLIQQSRARDLWVMVRKGRHLFLNNYWGDFVVGELLGS